MGAGTGLFGRPWSSCVGTDTDADTFGAIGLQSEQADVGCLNHGIGDHRGDAEELSLGVAEAGWCGGGHVTICALRRARSLRLLRERDRHQAQGTCIGRRLR